MGVPVTNLAIETEGITRAFSGNRVLDRVDLSVQSGEVHALIGENGAGKSTLMRILSGADTDFDGEVRLHGSPVRFTGPRDAEDHGLAMIYQELNLIPALTAAENVYLGREPVDALGRVDFKRMRADAEKILERLDFAHSADVPVYELRVGEQQIVEIARAISRSASVLIMDEPTSVLTEAEAGNLFRLVKSLQNDGVTIIYISHRLDEIDALADRVTVLRDGVLIGTRVVRDTSRADLIHMMVGREIEDLYRQATVEREEVVLEVEDLWLGNTSAYVNREVLLRSVSFEVRAGEIFGLGGLLGAGRSEILQAVFGAAQGWQRGRIRLDGAEVNCSTPAHAMSAGIAYVTEDRKSSGLVLSLDVATNIGLASMARRTPAGVIRKTREWALAEHLVDRLSIRVRGLDQEVATLSGGNQQKVVLAKWLATHPRVLLLDEPTRGVDVGAKADIYRILAELAEQGIAIVLVSSDLQELVHLANRVLVIREGAAVALLEREAIRQQLILEYAAVDGPIQPGFHAVGSGASTAQRTAGRSASGRADA
jgi:ABC-type sugar transport system ATPase subunit